jgi:hypothetical protein
MLNLHGGAHASTTSRVGWPAAALPCSGAAAVREAEVDAHAASTAPQLDP